MVEKENQKHVVKRLACINCGSTDFELHSLNKEDIDAICSQCNDTVATLRYRKNERAAWFRRND